MSTIFGTSNSAERRSEVRQDCVRWVVRPATMNIEAMLEGWRHKLN